MLVPLGVAFFAAVVAMGVVADPKTFRPQPVESAAGIVREIPSDVREMSQSGLNHWRSVLFFATHVPEVCWSDNAVNDFQRRQCDEFWERLGMGALLSLLPFGAVWLVWASALGSFQGFYRTARKRVEAAKPVAGGVVTDPAQAPGDLFSRFYCLRPIGVQLTDGRQVKVYLPLDSPMPLPGVKMAVFEPISALGEPRHLGQVYAPHVAVVAGVRQS